MHTQPVSLISDTLCMLFVAQLIASINCNESEIPILLQKFSARKIQRKIVYIFHYKDIYCLHYYCHKNWLESIQSVNRAFVYCLSGNNYFSKAWNENAMIDSEQICQRSDLFNAAVAFSSWHNKRVRIVLRFHSKWHILMQVVQWMWFLPIKPSECSTKRYFSLIHL